MANFDRFLESAKFSYHLSTYSCTCVSWFLELPTTISEFNSWQNLRIFSKLSNLSGNTTQRLLRIGYETKILWLFPKFSNNKDTYFFFFLIVVFIVKTSKESISGKNIFQNFLETFLRFSSKNFWNNFQILFENSKKDSQTKDILFFFANNSFFKFSRNKSQILRTFSTNNS